MSKEIVIKDNKSIDTYGTESLISQAIQQGANIDVMERLMVMREKIKAERAKEDFFLALSKFQSEITAVPKIKEVDFPSKNGGRVKYSYAPIEAIIDHVKAGLRDNGFSYTLKTEQTDKMITVTCEAHHGGGHTEKTSLSVPMQGNEKMNVIQQIGAAITYAKRYAFCNAFGIMTGDEDTDAVDDTSGEQDKKGDRDKDGKWLAKGAVDTIKKALRELYDYTGEKQSAEKFLAAMLKNCFGANTKHVTFNTLTLDESVKFTNCINAQIAGAHFLKEYYDIRKETIPVAEFTKLLIKDCFREDTKHTTALSMSAEELLKFTNYLNGGIMAIKSKEGK